ncbi:hypothetical protein PROFUN_13838 [Planoprotostelium fungivorum]|uniref:Uncharacterized protein n=1 Tax=Planoprotostelium fungivorum TaxID=1890364 RepID=A0A2P6N2Y7_9EUKA|nr:hypothetical protein PROFUN_13838 [Planoprotostelium fungivorum]
MRWIGRPKRKDVDWESGCPSCSMALTANADSITRHDVVRAQTNSLAHISRAANLRNNIMRVTNNSEDWLLCQIDFHLKKTLVTSNFRHTAVLVG